MRVCDVVLDSVWYDPRVRKQIDAYSSSGVDLYVVGAEDARMNKDEIDKIKGHVTIVQTSDLGDGRLKSVYQTIKRLVISNNRIVEAIVASGADVIHANDLNALVPAYKAAKKLKCKLVYDSHEIFVENHQIAISRLKKFYWGFQEKRLIKKVDMLVCVSHAAADYLMKKYKLKKSMVVTNCCEHQDEKNFLPKAEKFEVLNHGKYYGGRGYDIMVKASKITTDPDIVYVLRGFGSMEEELRKLASDNNSGNIRFDPPVKVYEMIRSASSSSVGVAVTEPTCLNFKLSVSNKLFEYAAAGLPVIMSDIPEHRYLNDKYNFGIIIPDNTPKSFTEAVIKLYTDKEFYNTCVKNAVKLSQEVNWENEFGKLIDFERELTGTNIC